MAKRTKRESDTKSTSYYDEDRLYGRSSVKAVTRTVIPIRKKGQLYPLLNDNTVSPHGVISWYLSGTPGAYFETNLTFQGGGGHNHSVGSSDERLTGTVSPSSGRLPEKYPQNLVQTYRAGAFCGSVHDHTIINNKPIEEDYTIVVGGLAPLGASTGIIRVGTTNAHPSNHWGTPSLCSQLAVLGAAFHEKFDMGLFVNDISLQNGGFFDVHGDLTSPHQTHQDGRSVDINYSTMSTKQRNWFKTQAESLGFVVEIHQNPVHWHLIL